MNRIDKENYITRYNKRLKQFGDNPRTLGWGGGKDRQFLRFKVLSEIGVQNSDSILDLGCGFCDMYEYLKKENWQGDYLGVDINQELLEIARNNNNNIDVRCLDVLETDIDKEIDWVLSSGVFNAKLREQDNVLYIERMLKKMFSISKKGVACDFMSTYVDFQHPIGFHLDPSLAIAIGKKITDRITIRMDYLKYEYCIYLLKDNTSK